MPWCVKTHTTAWRLDKRLQINEVKDISAIRTINGKLLITIASNLN
jgi:hypothetical protein